MSTALSYARSAPSAYQMGGFGSPVTRSTRDIEYDAFSHATRLLCNAQKGAGSPVHAAYVNSELWTVLAGDLADDENELPTQLRASLLSIAMFSIRHCRSVMAGDATVDALIDINLSIMKGLRGEAAA